MAVSLLLALISTASSLLGNSDMNMQEMMKAFSEIEDNYSLELDSNNFQSALANNSNPWFIFFHEPRAQSSVIKNAVWFIFGSNLEKRNFTSVNLGKVDMSKDQVLRRKFKVSSFPVFLYLEGGYSYNYSGTFEPEDFERVLDEKLYLQYDRQRFSVSDEVALKDVWKKEFLKGPAEWIGGLFLTAFLGLSSFKWMCCRGKKEAVKEAGSERKPRKRE